MNYDYRPFLFADKYALSTYTRDPTLIRLLQEDKVAFTSRFIQVLVADSRVYFRKSLIGRFGK